jgi:hypothetical protein
MTTSPSLTAEPRGAGERTRDEEEAQEENGSRNNGTGVRGALPWIAPQNHPGAEIANDQIPGEEGTL